MSYPKGLPKSEASKRQQSESIQRYWQDRRLPPHRKVCEYCHKTYETRRAWGKKPKQRYCSISCAVKGSHGYGPFHHNWKTGRYINSQGYAELRINKKLYREHRVIMERLLGRPLRSDESVHHRDGNKLNNDPANLELRNRYHGNGATKHCLTCTCK
jgi:hypothetical protein